MTKYIIVATVDGITSITLNRPQKRNAMSAPLVQELLDVLPKLANDSTTRVLILNGKGEHFCAGADISWMQKIATETEDKNFQDAYMIAELMLQLYSFPKPTITLAHGATLGGGLGLLAASDIGIAARNTSFGFSEVKIGLAPSTISPYVVAAMGPRAAKYYFLTGERFGVDEALRVGLVHRIAENEALMSVGMNLAQALLQNGPKALTAAKQLVHHVADKEISDILAQRTAEHLANLRATSEAQEGFNAFLEKRAPNWR